jgi:hypothetical protein
MVVCILISAMWEVEVGGSVLLTSNQTPSWVKEEGSIGGVYTLLGIEIIPALQEKLNVSA